jgi:molybdopterin-guanine dinucleotide biosynthesis protein A
MNTFTVAISAGGKSSRMGTDKSFVPLLGKPMIEHVLERVSQLGQAETILITNKPELYAYLNLPMFSDVLPEKGSLGGIYTAIHHSKSDDTLCVACDMPFLNPKLLRYMLDLRDESGAPYNVIVPRVEGYPEGMHALYSKACLEPIRARLDADRLKIIGFYDDVRVRYIDEAEYQTIDPKRLSFQNINTPDELREAQQRAQND